MLFLLKQDIFTDRHSFSILTTASFMPITRRLPITIVNTLQNHMMKTSLNRLKEKLLLNKKNGSFFLGLHFVVTDVRVIQSKLPFTDTLFYRNINIGKALALITLWWLCNI